MAVRNRAFIGLIFLIAVAVAAGISQNGDPSDLSDVSTIEVTTGADIGATPGYGLLGGRWEKTYNGTSPAGYDYDFDGDGNATKEQCANCHMNSGRSGKTDKHIPPLHPIAIEANVTEAGDSYSGLGSVASGWSGQWFHDDDQHRGPNTRLAAAYAGIRLKGKQVECGVCHTARDPVNAFGPEINSSDQFTNDPHSVHRDVSAREGCIRCHVYSNTSFYADDPTAAGFQQNTLVFTQGNATRNSHGIANPINMTRVWDYSTPNGPVFLSTTDEANYSYSPGGGGLTTSGNGWTLYGSADGGTEKYSCTDCHDRFHAEQGFADTGGYGLEFAFNDSAGSRKGPYAPVNDSESIGVVTGGRNITCGLCHPTDVHAVHTNGGMVSKGSYAQVNDGSDQSIFGMSTPYTYNGSILGAELCDECHTDNLDGLDPNRHFDNADGRGLGGEHHQEWFATHNRYPDLEATSQNWGGVEDCGFCHRIGGNN